MPYATESDIPAHLQSLSLARANKWARVFDAVKAGGADEEKAARIAWSVVRKARPTSPGKGASEKDGDTLAKSVSPDQITLPGSNRVQPPARHSVPTPKPTLALRPSAKNPGVLRWQESAPNAEHYGEHGHRFLGLLHSGSGHAGVFKGQFDNERHFRHLINDRLIRLEVNPEHYRHEYTAHLTEKGRKYFADYKAEQEGKREQEPLFKAVDVFHGVRLLWVGRPEVLRKSVGAALEKAVIPALDMVPEDLEDTATPDTWTEGDYQVAWKRGKKGHGSVTFTGGPDGKTLPMPFVMTAAGKKHARALAAQTVKILAKGTIPLLDGVFRIPRRKI